MEVILKDGSKFSADYFTYGVSYDKPSTDPEPVYTLPNIGHFEIYPKEGENAKDMTINLSNILTDDNLSDTTIITDDGTARKYEFVTCLSCVYNLSDELDVIHIHVASPETPLANSGGE